MSTPSGTATFVGKRQRSLDASASVTLDISSELGGRPIIAGLALYKDALRHVSVGYDFQSSQLLFDVTTTSEDKRQSSSFEVQKGTTRLGLRVETSTEEYKLFYRDDDGETWKKAGTARVADLVAREMTGPIFGLFAHAVAAEAAGQKVTFREFSVGGRDTLVE